MARVSPLQRNLVRIYVIHPARVVSALDNHYQRIEVVPRKNAFRPQQAKGFLFNTEVL